MPDNDALQLVNLDQLAALVRLSKRTLERHVKSLPQPYRYGRGGRPTLWIWAEVRPYLIEEFGMPRLPERLPKID